MSRPAARSGLTGKPRASRRASAADWLSTAAGAGASNRPPGAGASSSSWYSQVERCRLAVTAGSFWRSDPAPLLRGFAYSGQALLLALRVDARELRLGHEHLAAGLERGGLRQPLRDRPDRAQVGGHVLAGRAVAARGAEREPAALVAQRDGEAVDLELRDVGQARARAPARRGSPRPLRTRASKARSSSWLNAFESESIGRWWRTSGKRPPARRAAHPLGRRVRGDEGRERRLERDQLPEQGVVLGVA